MALVEESLSETDTKNYKAIFISDVHLGSKACQAELLLDFLKYNDSEKLYLVGDIVDGWRLKRMTYRKLQPIHHLHSLNSEPS